MITVIILIIITLMIMIIKIITIIINTLSYTLNIQYRNKYTVEALNADSLKTDTAFILTVFVAVPNDLPL